MTTHAISRFPVPDLAALPADLQKLFHDVSEKAGFDAYFVKFALTIGILPKF